MYLSRSSLTVVLVALASLLVAGMAWAGFTGPNRTTTEMVRDPGNDEWTCEGPGGDCTFRRGSPNCGSHPSRDSQIRVCGWVADRCGCEEAYAEVTTTLPPATVSGSTSCSDTGDNGWCRAGAALNLTATEPLGGHLILVIEGEPGGVLCDPADAPSVSCSWTAGGEGDFTVNFWAVSSYGDTSSKGSAQWKVDSQPPSVTLNLGGGEVGGGGWYRSGTVTASASGGDSVSGVASASVSSPGGSWQATLQFGSDGVHQIVARVTDRAGNSASKAGEIKYDGSPPSVKGSISGTQGSDGWYTGSVTATASASDGLSGVATSEVKVDGGSWQNSPAVVAGDGTHQVSFRAADVAGNQSTSGESTVRIDGTPPHSSFRTPADGSQTWISGQFTFAGESSDATSGLARVELSLNNGASWQVLSRSGGDWGYTWDTRSIPNGTYVVLARAQDVAGNRESTARVTVRVDNEPPLVDIPDAWLLGEHAPLRITEHDIGLDRVEIEIASAGRRMALQNYTAGAVPESVRWDGVGPDGQPAPAGPYQVTAVAWDLAGNRGSDSGILTVPAAAPIEDTAPTVEAAPIEDTAPTVDRAPIELEQVSDPKPQPGAPQDRRRGIPGAAGASELAAAPVAESEEVPADFRRIWIWPAFAWAGLLAALGYAKLTDPRPRTLRGLRADLRQIRKLQH